MSEIENNKNLIFAILIPHSEINIDSYEGEYLNLLCNFKDMVFEWMDDLYDREVFP